jgi:hypothetical protein
MISQIENIPFSESIYALFIMLLGLFSKNLLMFMHYYAQNIIVVVVIILLINNINFIQQQQVVVLLFILILIYEITPSAYQHISIILEDMPLVLVQQDK